MQDRAEIKKKKQADDVQSNQLYFNIGNLLVPLLVQFSNVLFYTYKFYIYAIILFKVTSQSLLRDLNGRLTLFYQQSCVILNRNKPDIVNF